MQLKRAFPAVAAVVALLTVAGCNGSGSNNAGNLTQPSSSPSAGASGQPAAKPTCPLTGAPIKKGESVTGPAVAVKIDNVSEALPQGGDNRADIVVEELVEGGLTRLMAIFQCNSAPLIGPIRSARITDANLLALLHGSILAFSGANPKDLPPIEAHGDAALISQDNDPQYFTRNLSRPAPHNVFSSTKQLIKAGLQRRPHLTAPKPLFSYGPIDPLSKRARQIHLTWPAATAIWTWSKGAWLRTQDGAADILTNRHQVSATNVVIMSVNIASTGLHDVLGNPVPLDVTVGSNPVWVARNGKMVKGTWKRPKITSPLTLLDSQGHVIKLAPGRTWIELLPKPGKPSRH
ncbi:MAG TPA: DUF3048 domain-containing protein [Mycobacteriales bacterium]|nr:DUF3048 domain-containing protein [Mycobacteriales bacterium]